MGKRWNDPDYLSELLAAEDAHERVKFWRSPVFGEKFQNVPAFLRAERDLGRVLGQAFHQGCALADAALATGLPPDRLVAIGKRTIRGTKWLGRLA